jgi:hypothetical protein
MRYGNIRVGDTLKLHEERREAYDWPTSKVLVEELVTRKGYKTPFIREGQAFFAPSDFKCHTASRG